MTSVQAADNLSTDFAENRSGVGCATLNTTMSSEEMKRSIEAIEEERDEALEEVEIMRETVSAIMEAIQILTRQVKKNANTDFSELSVDQDILPSISSDLSFDVDPGYKMFEYAQTCDSNESNLGINRNRTFSGVSSATIASYASDDNQRFSHLIQHSFHQLYPALSTIGADLMALDEACRVANQNARLMSEESLTTLQDLQYAHSSLDEVDDRCLKAEQCAKRLYKKNKALQKKIGEMKAERKLLVQEIKNLNDAKNNQKELFYSMKAHDVLLKGENNDLQNTKNSMIEESKAPEESAKEKSNVARPASDSDNCKPETDEKTTDIPRNRGNFNPFGKLFSSLNGSKNTDKKVEQEKVEDTVITKSESTGSNVGQISHTPAAPVTPVEFIKPTLALDGPEFSGWNDDDTNSAILQLTPTPSSCDGMNSILSPRDLDPQSVEKFPRSPTFKEGPAWKQRQVNSSFAPPRATKKAVVTVKMSNKKRTMKAGSISVGLPGNTSSSTSTKKKDNRKPIQYGYFYRLS